MTKIWIIAILLFLIVTFLIWKFTKEYVKNVYGKKMFKQWGTRAIYWHGALFVSGGLTVLIIFLLKWTNVLTF